MKLEAARHALSRRGSWLLAISIALLLGLADPGAVRRLDLLIYDQLEPLFRAPALAPASAVIAIDDRTLAALGQWPLDRSLHAALITRLDEAGADAIAVSILFPEPSAGDDALAEALFASGKVVLPVAPRPQQAGFPGVLEILPTPQLASAAAALGHVDVELDSDALARRTFFHAGSGGPHWEALALASLRVAGQATDSDGAIAAEAHPQRVSSAWHRAGELLLPYPDAGSAPIALSYIEVLEKAEMASLLRGRSVFVGVTALGLDAGLPTPASPEGQPMAAVEFHARAFEALRSGNTYRTAPPWLTLAVCLACLLVPTLLFPRVKLRAAAALGALAFMPLLAAGLGLTFAQLWIPPGNGLIAFAVGYIGWFAHSLRRARGSLQRARRDADATLRSIADAVIMLDGAARVQLSNPVAEALTAQRLAKSRGQPLQHLLTAFTDQAEEILSLVGTCINTHQTLRLQTPIEWHAPDGGRRSLQVTATPVGGRYGGAVLAFNDVSELLAATAQLRFEATHDALTALPNRTLLLDRLQNALLRANRQGEMIALLFVDLDRFKRINDSLGHSIGDAVLKFAAARLLESVRDGDTVSRWGGDEFIILMEHLKDRSAVIHVAQRVLGLLERPFDIGEESGLVLSCSIGIAIGPQDSMDAQTLLSMADKAMYQGKQVGGSSYTFYAPEMNNWTRDRLNLEGALRHALQYDEFEMFYQPQVDVADRRLVGFESLIRWRRPGAGLVPPDRFIPVAEESGIICPIGDWVVHAVVEQAARWQRAGLATVPVGINVSARQCLDTSVVDSLKAALRDTGLDPRLLKVELTESTAMKDPQRALDLLHNINALGVEIAVDDFGTGYSSLSLLQRFPISELKIDRSFVSDVGPDNDNAAIVRGTIALAHGLGMRVVAEGVETDAQLAYLAAYHCDVAQGYLFSRPRPADELDDWLAAPGDKREACG